MNWLGNPHLILFTSGAVMMAAACVALLFFQSWKTTGDRFFLIFSIAFAMLAIERIVLELMTPLNIDSYNYLIRLAAYCCILWAIIEKNRRSG